MQTNIEPPVMPAEANDSRTANDKAVVCNDCVKPATMTFEKTGHNIPVCDDCAIKKMRSLLKGHGYVLKAIPKDNASNSAL